MGTTEQLIKTLSKDAVKVSTAPHPFTLTLKWTVAATVYLAVSLAITGLRPDLTHAFERSWYVIELASLLGIFLATSVGAAVLAFPDLYQKRGIVFVPFLMFALFLTVILFEWHADNPPAPLPVHTYECTTCIILVALLPAVWTFYSIRKLASTHLYLAGCFAVLSAFSVGALWLRLHEINDSIAHVVEWHYLPMLAAGIIGLWLGKIILKW